MGNCKGQVKHQAVLPHENQSLMLLDTNNLGVFSEICPLKTLKKKKQPKTPYGPLSFGQTKHIGGSNRAHKLPVYNT